MTEVVYIDGACFNNGKKNAIAGIGVYFGENDSRNISRPLPLGRQTNQRAVVMAAIDAVQNSNRYIPLIVKTNSIYVVKGITIWIKQWEKNGFKTVKGTPVVNADLFKELKKKCQNRGSVKFSHIKDHQDFYGGSCADMLAKAGAKLRKKDCPRKATLNKPVCVRSRPELSTSLDDIIKDMAKNLTVYKTRKDGSLVLVIIQDKNSEQTISSDSKPEDLKITSKQDTGNGNSLDLELVKIDL